MVEREEDVCNQQHEGQPQQWQQYLGSDSSHNSDNNSCPQLLNLHLLWDD